MEKIPYLGLTLVRWHVGNSTFLALPEKGARLTNWKLALGDGTVRDVVFWPKLRSIEEFYQVKGGNPILFPFCGRSFDHGKIHFWRDPKGVRRALPINGIARLGDFNIINLDEQGFSAQFMPGTEGAAAYPFDYEFKVTYHFESYSLSCELTLTNLDAEPIPWCAGHHFYFTLPWREGAARSDYLIRIPAAKRLRHDFASGKLIPGPILKEEENMANPGLIDTVHTDLQGNEVVFGEKGREGDLVVRIGTAKIPPPDTTFLTWTADNASPFYCVEPWMGPPNAAENRIGLHWVQPGQTATFIVDVRLK